MATTKEQVLMQIRNFGKLQQQEINALLASDETLSAEGVPHVLTEAGLGDLWDAFREDMIRQIAGIYRREMGNSGSWYAYHTEPNYLGAQPAENGPRETPKIGAPTEYVDVDRIQSTGVSKSIDDVLAEIESHLNEDDQPPTQTHSCR